jgi:hypothetical protein
MAQFRQLHRIPLPFHNRFDDRHPGLSVQVRHRPMYPHVHLIQALRIAVASSCVCYQCPRSRTSVRSIQICSLGRNGPRQ